MILNEEIARVNSRSFITINHNFQMTQDYISRLGNQRQKDTYLLKNEREVREKRRKAEKRETSPAV